MLLPCHNEATAIGQVVAAFRSSLPSAVIYVYDNASTDRTAELARAAGATVRQEPRKGKGNVVRSMFANIDADVYVIADGDDTYDATAAPLMVDQLIRQQLDMIVGAREVAVGDGAAYRKGHTFGNSLFSWTIRNLFGGEFTDVFSGYRVMSRRFVKSLPVFSSGFEIEAELSVHSVRIMARTVETRTRYQSRSSDSASKLRTYRDGFRILLTMVRLFEEMRPFQFFGICAGILTIVALALGLPVVGQFAHTGYVPRFPTAILAASIQIIAFLFFASGIILRSVGRARDEFRRLIYLQTPSLQEGSW